MSHETDPAAEALWPVRAFVDTYDTEDDRESLTTPEALRGWLVERGLLGENEPVAQADLAFARRVREALRALMLANAGAAVDPGAVEILNNAARETRLVAQFAPDGGSELRPETRGAPGAVGHLLGLVFRAMADGSWSRVKVCLEGTCRVTFYDQSKNRSRMWCSMSVCGNRTKARSYRERHRDA